jgi:hypothetical protein
MRSNEQIRPVVALSFTRTRDLCAGRVFSAWRSQVIGMMAPVAVEIIVIAFNRGHSSTVQNLISTARLTPT